MVISASGIVEKLVRDWHSNRRLRQSEVAGRVPVTDVLDERTEQVVSIGKIAAFDFSANHVAEDAPEYFRVAGTTSNERESVVIPTKWASRPALRAH